MKRIFALIAIVPIAFILLLSCKPENQDPEPTRDVEIEFNDTDMDEQLDVKILQELSDDKSIRCIYLKATKHWDSFYATTISIYRENFFQPRFNLFPKLRGRGDFDFKLGEASKVPEDSLWFVQQGWTINKKYQH